MIKPPYVYFGGKSAVADIIWKKFGNPDNYVEPFFGGGAVLLYRDTPCKYETINDVWCYIPNFWRAVQQDPKEVAKWASQPVYEVDLHARNYVLTEAHDTLRARLEGNPDWCSPKLAGYWLYCSKYWIGSKLNKNGGKWSVVDGEMIIAPNNPTRIIRQKPDTNSRPTFRGMTQQDIYNHFEKYIYALQTRVATTTVYCGDWSKCMTPAVLERGSDVKTTAVFLDPPYTAGEFYKDVYVNNEVSDGVYAWAIENGNNPKYRIALCDYEGSYDMPKTWTRHRWSANIGWAKTGKGEMNTNRHREVIWFSPHCVKEDTLF